MKYNLIFFFFFWFGAAVWSSHFLTVLVILTHITWAPVLFGWGSLAVSSLRMRPGPLQSQLRIVLPPVVPFTHFSSSSVSLSPSPPSHHRTLLHHACNYGVTGEMSVAKFSLAVRVGNWGFRAIQLEFSGLVTPGKFNLVSDGLGLVVLLLSPNLPHWSGRITFVLVMNPILSHMWPSVVCLFFMIWPLTSWTPEPVLFSLFFFPPLSFYFIRGLNVFKFTFD